MSQLEELREVQVEIQLNAKRIREIKDAIKNHPAKPAPGNGKLGKRWAQVKQHLENRRQDLGDENRELNSEIQAIKRDLNQEPLPAPRISDVLNGLVEIEALMSIADHTAAWDRLTELTDWLEARENQ